MGNIISVLGIGRLGLSFALLAAHRGYGVLGQDLRMTHDEIQKLRDEYFE